MIAFRHADLGNGSVPLTIQEAQVREYSQGAQAKLGTLMRYFDAAQETLL